MSTLNKINLINESPVNVDNKDIFANDKLNFKSAVINLDTLFAQVQKPYTVGIFGDWGTGKTSFMKMLQKTLEQDEKSFATYWFDAWKYETDDNLILPLLYGISDKFKNIKTSTKNSLIKSASVIGLSFSDIFLKSCTAGALSKNDIMENFEFFENNSAKFYQHFSDSVMQLESAFKRILL